MKTNFKIVYIFFVVILLLPFNILADSSSCQEPKNNIEDYAHWATILGTIVGAIISSFGFYIVYCQLKEQKQTNKIEFEKQDKRDNIELVIKLSSDFYNNDNYMRIFEIVDIDENNQAEVESREEKIKKIIDGEINDQQIKEIHLNAYLNFFNSLAVLVEEGVLDKKTIRNIFNYQLKKTFASNKLKEYMTNYDFKKVLINFENLD